MKKQASLLYDPIGVFFLLMSYQVASVIVALILCAGFGLILNLVFGSSIGGLAQAGPGAILAFLFLPVTIIVSFYVGGVALLIGYIASLFLLSTGELRRWVWVSVLGGIGLAWGLVFAYGSRNATFPDAFNFITLMCFLTAAGCGYQMADYAKTLADPELQALQPPKNYDFNFHIRVLLNIASAFGLAVVVFVPLLFGVAEEIMSPSFSFSDVLKVYGKFPLFLIWAYGIGFAGIAAAYLLTVRLLRRNEQRAWVWIAGYTALGLFPGWFPALAFVPQLFNGVFILTPLSIFLAAVSGTLMWWFARHLKESLPHAMIEPEAETEKGVTS